MSSKLITTPSIHRPDGFASGKHSTTSEKHSPMTIFLGTPCTRLLLLGNLYYSAQCGDW